MQGKTHSMEEVIRILRQADGGKTAQSVCREYNIFEHTFYRWKKKYGDTELAYERTIEHRPASVGIVWRLGNRKNSRLRINVSGYFFMAPRVGFEPTTK